MTNGMGPIHIANRTGWTTSIRLIGEMRGNNQGPGWQRFVELYSALLNYWFQADNINTREWADLRQEVFLAVAKGLRTFQHEPNKQSFRGWLRVIARNKVGDYYRQRLPQTNVDEIKLRAYASATEATDEAKILYRRALELICMDFEPTTWQSFWLTVVEGKPTAEVADLLNLSVDSVFQNKSRVLRRLKAEFKGYLSGEPPTPPET